MAEIQDVKAVHVYYFKEDGEFYDKVEELVPGEWGYTYIIKEMKKRRRHSSLDMLVMDSGDGVLPYITPYLDKVMVDTEYKGFFR